MKRRLVKDRCCLNPDCPIHGRFGERNINLHSFYTTRQGRRRRYLCKACNTTFSSTAGTPYYRLHKSRTAFDEVAEMAVEGVGISATARIKHLSPNTVVRWREQAATYAKQFNHQVLKDFELIELQADEIRSFVNTKTKVVWILTLIEVSCRLWISYIVGRRSYRNVRTVFGSAICWGRYTGRILFTSDGFEPYAWTVKAMLPFICVYGQVMKKRSKDRVVRVDRRLVTGTRHQLEWALLNSEDSSTINTSFIERHNLTIRQGSSYLTRRAACHAKEQEYLDGNMALLMCYYNFIRPHSALKCGHEIRTPAMQAGLVSKKLRFRDVFTSRVVLFLCLIALALVRLMKCRTGTIRTELTTVN